MTNELKKSEYWSHFLSVVRDNKKYYRGLTARRLEIAKEKLWHDKDFWLDIVSRRGGEGCALEEMQKNNPEDYSHMIGNFASLIYQRLE